MEIQDKQTDKSVKVTIYDNGRYAVNKGVYGNVDPLSIILSKIETISCELKEEIKMTRMENKDAVSTITKNLHNAVSFMNENCNKIGKETARLKEEDEKLKNLIDSLKKETNINTQYRYNNTIKLFNIPKTANEDLHQLFQKICDLIKFEFYDWEVDSIYRLKDRMGQRSHPLIIINFVRNVDKIKFLSLKRKNKKVMYTTDLDGSLEKLPIFVSDYLSPFNQRLFKIAREMKNKGIFQHVWTRNGQICVKKNSSLPIIMIRTASDLNKCCNEDNVHVQIETSSLDSDSEYPANPASNASTGQQKLI
ncbi:uncharacterized protein [Rhodnius prolixus]|uniref:uncharacterized protein n=1 Tax=Rhodnius prolixus TaxID=13249 RepID=UPI003D18F6DC